LIELSGIPADTVSTEDSFDYLLLHGYNKAGWWNESPWFEVGELSPDPRQHFIELVKCYDQEFGPRPALGFRSIL
jgi:hypothetical protein